jgi:VanZ family protein
MKTRLITSLYVVLLVVIVLLADHREYHTVFDAVRRIPGGDKLGHFLLMGLFSFLMNVSLSCRTVRISAARVLLGSAVVCAAVTLEEFSQIFVRYRTFDLVDLAFDYAGIWAFGRLALYVELRRGRCSRRAS